MQTSVRELVREVQGEMRGADLLPSRASDLLNKLTGILGSANTELRLAELDYKRDLRRCMERHEAANRARIDAETSPEYARYLEAKHVKEEIVEAIRSLKAYLRTQEEEMRLAR